MRALQLSVLQVNQVSKGFMLMQTQLKIAQEGINNPEGDRFAEVVKPFLGKAKVSQSRAGQWGCFGLTLKLLGKLLGFGRAKSYILVHTSYELGWARSHTGTFDQPPPNFNTFF